MLKNWFYLILLVLGIPIGYLLFYLCKDEIKKWKKRLTIMIIISLILIPIMFFINFIYKIPVIISLLFMDLVFFTILLKNHRFC